MILKFGDKKSFIMDWNCKYCNVMYSYKSKCNGVSFVVVEIDIWEFIGKVLFMDLL